MIACRYLPIVLSLSAALLLGACSRTQEASRATADEDVTEVKLIPPYESLDKDKDGIVTLAEVDAVAPDCRAPACLRYRPQQDAEPRRVRRVQADQRFALIHHRTPIGAVHARLYQGIAGLTL